MTITSIIRTHHSTTSYAPNHPHPTPHHNTTQQHTHTTPPHHHHHTTTPHHNTTQHNTTQHNTTQHKQTTQHTQHTHTKQNNTTHNKTTQHNTKQQNKNTNKKKKNNTTHHQTPPPNPTPHHPTHPIIYLSVFTCVSRAQQVIGRDRAHASRRIQPRDLRSNRPPDWGLSMGLNPLMCVLFGMISKTGHNT